LRSRSRRGRRPAALLGAGVVAAVIAVAVPASASANFSEYFGGGSLCGSNCYIESAGAHTFVIDEGWSSSGSPQLACQLFNGSGANEVTHGNGYCDVYYFGGAYVHGRVYNQSGKTYGVTGYAET
jgi:hypothetical protein